MDWCFYELLENIIPFEKPIIFVSRKNNSCAC